MSEKNNVIISICGPSTAGKTILSNLLKSDAEYNGVVTTTTRPQRTGETNGVNYYFVTEAEFEEMKSTGKLLENISFNGYQYGASTQGLHDALNKTNPSVIVMEPEGANALEAYCLANDIKNLKVFVNNPMEVLIERIQQRFAEDKKATTADYQARLFNMVFFEPQNWTAKAHSGEHNYHLIFDSFNSENTDEVLQEVQNHVNKLKKNNKHSPK